MKVARNVLGLLVLVIVLDQLVSFLVPTFKKRGDFRIEALANGDIKTDTIVIGASRGFFGLSTNDLGSNYYNLCFKGSNAIFHKRVVDLLLEKHQPKTILWILDDDHYFFNNGALRDRVDLFTPFVADDRLNESVCEFYNKSELLASVLKSYRYSENVPVSYYELINGVKGPVNSQGDGDLNRSFTSNVEFEVVKSYQDSLINPDYLEAFNLAVDKIQADGIDILFLILPNRTKRNDAFHEFLMTQGLKVYRDTSDLFQNNKYFGDQSHLNPEGKDLFTKRLKEYLQSN